MSGQSRESAQFSRRSLLTGMAAAGAAVAVGAELINPAQANAAPRPSLPLIGRAEGNRLHIMSYNIRVPVDPASGGRAWEHRRNHIHQLLVTELPTSLGLQEAQAEQVDWLRSHLPSRYKVLAKNAWVPGSRPHPPETTALIYDSHRLKLVDHGYRWFSDHPDQQGSIWAGETFRRVRMITWAKYSDLHTGKQFVHLNTHLDTSSHYRYRSAKALRAFADTFRLPWVITADFNADDASPSHDQICAGRAYDTWFAPGASKTPYYRTTIPLNRTTHKWGPQPSSSGGKIDWIVVSRQFSTARATINTWVAPCPTYGPHAASDHWPVQARIYL